MARGRDYISFFNDPQKRRSDSIFSRTRFGRLRGLLLVAVLAAVAVGAWWFLLRDLGATSPEVAAEAAATTVPSVLFPSESGTTTLPGTDQPATVIDCEVVASDWSLFQGGPSRTGCRDVRTISDPEILWTLEIGVQGWLNNPVIANGTIYVGSAGVVQFDQDRFDGIYAIDAATGTQLWFVGTELDVNGVAYGQGVVVATGDEGRVWALDASDGSTLWDEVTGIATFGNPLVLGDMVVVGDAAGNVTSYDLDSGTVLWRKSVAGAVRGGAASDGTLVFVAGEQHEVVAFELDGTEAWRTAVAGRDPSGDQVRIFAAPTVVGGSVVVSLVREDVFAEPAMLALDRRTGQVQWRATDAAGIKSEWGNVRSSPAAAGDLLVYGEPYSSSLVALDVASGETRWAADAGVFCFPHWPSPAVTGGIAILARHDGAVYGIDLATAETVWSIYLGAIDNAGRFPDTYGEEFCQWQPVEGASVLASPAVADDGIVVVGTLEGFIVAIGDRSWE